MLPPSTCWAPVQCQLSVNQYQLVSSLYQPVSSWQALQSDKSHLFKWLFEKNGFLAVSGSNLGLELVTSSLRQNSSWTCVSTSFSLPCINFQALIRTISWNRWKAIRTCLWTRQDLCSPLTGSDLIFAVSAYGMGKGRPEKLWSHRSLSTSWLAKLATPRMGHQWPKCFVNPFSSQILCCCLSKNVHLIMVNCGQHCTVSEIWDLHPCKI